MVAEPTRGPPGGNLSYPSTSVLIDGTPGIPLRRAGPPDHAGRAGLRRPAARRCRRHAPRPPGAAPAAPDPDGFGERAAAGPLHAALQPPRAVSDRAAGARGLPPAP